MNRAFSALLVLACLTLGFPVQAHTKLSAIVPGDEEVLHQPPEALRLTYSGTVFPLKVTLTNASGEEIDFDFQPSANASSQFNWSLPPLDAGRYRVAWQVMGQDGHKMSGESHFELKPAGQ
ncbi:hypothetical protein HMF8227_01833 [Saliniradius amylolyticus]|uniref:CopC domain-containing protein n=1 Tax=Saliniradius amylolyticus TaxID=2183582 RepID=A0A2S2E3S4_9ALTE|nr:copper resistance CopC family protein [Saliniradius amylolyticus]AWL12306.1 hypothetical protein HMF8227_01833 [Saliniradius amylolyticus]